MMYNCLLIYLNRTQFLDITRICNDFKINSERNSAKMKYENYDSFQENTNFKLQKISFFVRHFKILLKK